MKESTEARRLLDLALYVAIAVALVGVLWGLAAYSVKSGRRDSHGVINWVCLGGVMAIVYISAIHAAGSMRRRARFWLGLGLALGSEVAIGVVALRGDPRVSAWTWAALYPINMIALGTFLDWWMGGRSAQEERGGGPTRG